MNRWLDIFVRTLAIAVAMVALGWVLGLLLPSEEVTEGGGVMGAFFYPLLSAFLLAAPLAYPIGRSRLSGRALLGVVFLAVFGLMTFLTQVEAIFFLDLTPTTFMIEALRLTLSSVALAWLAVTLYPKLDNAPAPSGHGPNPPSTASWVRRWVSVSFAYLVLYFGAGLMIVDIVMPYYEAQGGLDFNPAVIFPLQILRGALFVAFVLPLLRSMAVTRRMASLSMAVMIPLVHAVAILIPPSPIMPPYIRHAHMIEIGWSNFVLGLLIGYLFWKPQPGAQTESEIV